MSRYAWAYVILLGVVLGGCVWLMMTGSAPLLGALMILILVADVVILVWPYQPMAYVSRWIDNYRYGRKPVDD